MRDVPGRHYLSKHYIHILSSTAFQGIRGSAFQAHATLANLFQAHVRFAPMYPVSEVWPSRPCHILRWQECRRSYPTQSEQDGAKQPAQNGLTLGNPSQATIGAQTGDSDMPLYLDSVPRRRHTSTQCANGMFVGGRPCLVTVVAKQRDGRHERT